jgi:predicted Fe-Mo cluster-binding NifX family protein
MKIAFTTPGDNLDAPLDPRFGRSPRFLLYDTDAGTFEVLDNHPNLQAASGAGIQAAEAVARSGAGAVVTGHCGPKAFHVLASAGIKIYNASFPTVREALEAYRAGRLAEALGADMEGHWA